MTRSRKKTSLAQPKLSWVKYSRRSFRARVGNFMLSIKSMSHLRSGTFEQRWVLDLILGVSWCTLQHFIRPEDAMVAAESAAQVSLRDLTRQMKELGLLPRKARGQIKARR